MVQAFILQAMNKDSLKTLMVRDKDFLKELYQSQSAVRAKQILQFSSDSKLKTLLLYLHFVANGEIKIKKQNFEKLENRHLKMIKKRFESKAAFRRLLQSERKEKLNVLNKLASMFAFLLFSVFNRS